MLKNLAVQWLVSKFAKITKATKMPKSTNTQKGGVALEYILVSTFAAIAAITLLGVMGVMAKSKLSKLAEKLNVPIEDFSINPFE